MENYYKIAGLNVKMDSFGRTIDQSRPYQICKTNKIDIIISSNIEEMKKRFPHLSDDGCEYLSTGKNFYSQLLSFDGMMIHASALVMGGKAYLFSADCGTGKSTHVCLWRRVFGDESVRVLNDDKPALRLENGTWYAYGTPWSGKTGQNLNIKAKLAGIAIIDRGVENEIEIFSGMKAVQALLAQTTELDDISQRLKQLELLDKLMSDIPIWKLRCNMEPEAAIVAYEAMSGEKWRK